MVRWIVIVVSVAASLSVKPADAPRAQSTNRVAVPQPPPLPQPPIMQFRQLLGMKVDEREKALAARPTNTQELLKQKLAEYDALPADIRENRLRTLELQWYLRPLMKASPTNRAAQLQVIPERDRELIAARLKAWDA